MFQIFPRNLLPRTFTNKITKMLSLENTAQMKRPTMICPLTNAYIGMSVKDLTHTYTFVFECVMRSISL